ncbi:MAG TPA: type II toxin-antitoxin system Phd/YefM family antitoxin [Firmicutes bacterium]|nr:type II toxin-antitoxin system Phd/YefM family antitoxin [Bacillota bacterium]
MALLRFKNDFLAHYDELCAAVRQSGDPVYIENEDGEADMVLLSAREYHRLTQQSALQQFFAAAAQDGAAGRRQEVDVLAELQKQEDEEGG